MSGYPNILQYYIWGFQVHFRIFCQTRAEAIFNHFDRGLSPKVALLGFLKNGVSEKPSICFEPEEIDYFKPIFKGLHQKAEKILKDDLDKDMLYSSPSVQQLMDERRKNRSIKKAIEELLNESQDGKDNIFFVSQQILLNDYITFVVLSLNREVYNSHTHLSIDIIDERFRLDKSVIESSVRLFLRDCEVNLQLPNPGEHFDDYFSSTEDLLKKAANNFVNTLARRGIKTYALNDVFKACNNISIHRYEGKENVGKVIITEIDSPQIEYSLQLEQPFPLNDFRKTRKMLQLTSTSIGVISNGEQVFGLGKIRESYDLSTESIFTIQFCGVHCWEIWHANQPLLLMKYGQPYFHREIISKSKFISDCYRLFKPITAEQIDNLYKLAVAATKQSNGALLIITSDAENESRRLSNQSLAIKPISLNEEMILSLTSIDGGVLIDKNGNALAHGVILDGIVSNNGDSARGSRYNSAITYYDFHSKASQLLIVVVSEDGSVDIIPNLRPQIRREEIEEVISLLEAIVKDFEHRNYNKVMQWLQERKFYLSLEQCNRINDIKKKIEMVPIQNFRILYEDFKPNPDMNDSYFFEA